MNPIRQKKRSGATASPRRAQAANLRGHVPSLLLPLLVVVIIAAACSSDPDPVASGSVSTEAESPDETAASPGAPPGVTDDSITITASGPFTGDLKTLADQVYANGLEVWQAEVNANGGIHGREVHLVKVDNQGTADGATAACLEAQSNGSFMVLGMLVTPPEVSCLNEAEIPVFDHAAGDLDESQEYVLVESYATALAPSFVSFLTSSYMEAGDKKVGIIYNGELPYLTALHDNVSAELEAQGIDLVRSESVSGDQASFVSEVSRLRDAGAEVVMMFTNLESPGILRDAKSIGYEPEWFAGAGGAAQDVLCQAAGADCEGVWALREFTGSNDPAFAEYVDKVREHRGDEAAATATTLDMLFYATGSHLGKMLELAGPDPTHESLLTGARSMEPYDNGLTGPFTLKDRPVGVTATFPLRCCNPDGTYEVLDAASEEFE